MNANRKTGSLLLGLAIIGAAVRAAAADAPGGAPDDRQLLATAADLSRPRLERELAGRQLLARQNQALPVLLAGLTDQRSILRQVSAILLGEMGDLRAEDALLAVAGGADPLAADNARRALGRLYVGLQPTELTPRLAASAAPEAVRAALEALASGTGELSEDLTARLCELLKSPEAEVRTGAALALGRAAGPAGAAAAADLLALAREEKVEAVLIALCRSVARLRPAQGGEELRRLADGTGLLAVEAAAALHGLGYGGASEALSRQLRDEAPLARARAVEVAAELRLPEGPELAARAAGDASPFVRLAAARAFVQFKTPGIPGELRELLRDSDAQVRAEAAVALDGLGMTGAIWTLREDLRGGEPAFRRVAAEALGRLKARAALTELGQALTDEDLELACRAAEALGQIGGDSAVAKLWAALLSPRPALAEAARQALAEATGEDPGNEPAAWREWGQKRGLVVPGK